MKPKFVYIGSPYDHIEPDVRFARYEGIRMLTAQVIQAVSPAVVPFSPIAYTHPFDVDENVKTNWYKFDLVILARCDAMFVVKQLGWNYSKGIKMEIRFCIDNKIPYCIVEAENLIDTINHYIEKVIEDEKTDTAGTTRISGQ